MLTLKIDVLRELKAKGITTYTIAKKNLISGTAMGHIRRGEVPDINTLNNICVMLRKRPEDVIDFQITNDEKIKYFDLT